MRTNREPNLRAQDGPKRHLFCADCEQIVGRHENAFVTTVFRPYLEDPGATIRYDSSLVRFCASISLRVVLFYGDTSDHLSPQQLKSMAHAADTWRRVVLGETDSPRNYEQHLVPLDVIEETTSTDLPPNMSRYLTRALDLDIVSNRQSAFTYAKLSRFCIIGLIQRGAKREFHQTRVALTRGTISPRGYTVPAALGTFMIGKAKLMADTYDQMSQRQRDRTIDAVRSDPERAAQSDTLRAITADMRLFGRTATSWDKSDGTK